MSGYRKKLEAMIQAYGEENGHHEPDTNAFVFDNESAQMYAEGLDSALERIDAERQAAHAKDIEAAYRDGEGNGYACGLIDGINGVSSFSDEWESSNTYASLHKGDKNGD